ncbi:homocysteine S-methyltransferase family protein [Alisedimentitalea sp. MJ-SS2]|uniref:homocysteine S-methyltransferase family protein n=1 Tax=Aliisedimentitalea sp. MJ-SS2 TaxID=3049795 RepID=UPI002910F5A1|nr:homocysteine S-methyltransferase family protein [Alisedimentitalea sp. MJ-SS2]MDU8929241.1 homocysteine S-methyltransferase family protein [Alisedimentitalea sp. MJ-SS2]
MTDITLLDGSIGQEILNRSGDRPTPLWSTRVMIDHPGIVTEVHKDYFNAGATIATTNSYAIHRDRMNLDGAGLDDQFENLVDLAISESEAARAAHSSGRIAASIGPLGASYRADACPPADQAAPLIAELVSLMDARVDLFLIETTCSVDQARGALMGCANATKPVWLSLTVSDDDGTRLRSGEPLADIPPLIEQFKPQAILLNCSRPEAISQGLPLLKPMGLPFGAYANGFTHITDGFLKAAPTVDALEKRRDLDPSGYADFAMSWVDQGATIVGGCCEVGPDHIIELANRLRAAGHIIV